eukprot:CAMPEP_0174385528 /NCGR_PEP_ID=MMETSP0811_2-20130205/126658_1 /TAXON_ID=73025 ORGANISM="Eutreptiella gymnastica-like, Strain CCMP1594" /NCGR_SAMPLE_ID=MMETSP0811_2 /ASSEMBLY_ACC=CAM_ASM_000667 /LENGTH=94 /DNA_ID=CAMNT_0015539873 /DNA_START=352 /DNA_END=637 /DNA_ORIENTATION=+
MASGTATLIIPSAISANRNANLWCQWVLTKPSAHTPICGWGNWSKLLVAVAALMLFMKVPFALGKMHDSVENGILYDGLTNASQSSVMQLYVAP